MELIMKGNLDDATIEKMRQKVANKKLENTEKVEKEMDALQKAIEKMFS